MLIRFQMILRVVKGCLQNCLFLLSHFSLQNPSSLSRTASLISFFFLFGAIYLNFCAKPVLATDSAFASSMQPARLCLDDFTYEFICFCRH